MLLYKLIHLKILKNFLVQFLFLNNQLFHQQIKDLFFLVLIIKFEDIKSLIETISSGFEFGFRFTPLSAIKKESFKIVVLGLVSSVNKASIAIESISLLFLIQSFAFQGLNNQNVPIKFSISIKVALFISS
jgi:hypothetical protein